MTLVTEDSVKTLAAFKGKESPVVSVYLDVDGRRYPRKQDYVQSFLALTRHCRTNGASAVADDLQRIEAFVKGGIDRSQTRGLALFSCSSAGLWQTFELGVPVRNQLVVNHTPHVRQLEGLINNNERFGVLVVDRQRARMFVFEQGQLIDHSERFDELPRHDDDRGDWQRDHVRDHAAAMAHLHVRRAAQVAFDVFQTRGFDHLILSAPVELVAEVERELHRYLRDRIAATLTLPASASVAQVRKAAMAIDEQVERGKSATLAGKVLDRLGTGGAVVGLEPVLGALADRRIETLVVSEGFEAPGWRCWGCDQVATKGRSCAMCGNEMVRVDDVVEEAVEVALGQSCRVVTCLDSADLDVHGRIGAFLRY
jgi:peptide subunit release factor 1 (eRF1)